MVTVTDGRTGAVGGFDASAELRGRLHEIKRHRYCVRPVLLRGATCDANGQVIWSTAAEPEGLWRKPCGNRREALCAPCAEVYRQDAFQLVSSGLRGGKGVPETDGAELWCGSHLRSRDRRQAAAVSPSARRPEMRARAAAVVRAGA